MRLHEPHPRLEPLSLEVPVRLRAELALAALFPAPDAASATFGGQVAHDACLFPGHAVTEAKGLLPWLLALLAGHISLFGLPGVRACISRELFREAYLRESRADERYLRDARALRDGECDVAVADGDGDAPRGPRVNPFRDDVRVEPAAQGGAADERYAEEPLHPPPDAHPRHSLRAVLRQRAHDGRDARRQ